MIYTMDKFSDNDWDNFTVLRKTREQMQRQNNLKKQAMREGNFVSEKKYGASTNKNAQSQSDINSRKLDDSNDAQKHKTIDRETSQQIIKARCAKKLTQDALAKQLNINVSIIKEYETGKAIVNHQILQKICRVLCIKLTKKK